MCQGAVRKRRMEPVFQSVLHGLPVLLTHFVVTLALLGAGVWLYTRLTPFLRLYK